MVAMNFFSFILLCLYFCVIVKKNVQLIELFVLKLKFRAAQKGRAFCVCPPQAVSAMGGSLPPAPAHLGSHRNLVFSPSSLQISHSLKEG